MLYVNSFYIFIRNIKLLYLFRYNYFVIIISLYLFRYIYLSMVPCGDCDDCDDCDDSVFKFDFFSYDSIIVVYNVAHPIPIILLTCVSPNEWTYML